MQSRSPFIKTVKTSLAAIEVQAHPAIEVQAHPAIEEEHLNIEEIFERGSCDCPACGGIDIYSGCAGMIY
jgi:hypothetical protein